MADHADFADTIIDAQIEEALKQHQLQRQQLADTPLTTVCEDCEADIPEARARIQGVTRCVECQTVEEKRMKRYY